MMELFRFVLMLVLLGVVAGGMFDSMYCGRHNCYEIMGVERTATKKEVNKAYRKLARELHPDHNDAPDAHEKFELLVAAYETLKSEVSRNDYDYLLDHPDVYYEHFYRFFRHSTPKVDVSSILVTSIIVLSVLHYLHKISSYNRAIDYALRVPTYRNQAKAMAEDEGLLSKKFFKGLSKDEQRAAENKILRDIIESKLDIKGGHGKPEWKDILAIQMLTWPFHAGNFAYFHARRCYKYKVMKQDPDDVEKDYMTRIVLKLTESQWENVPEGKREEMLKKELWFDANRDAYMEERADAERAAKMNSAKYKQQKRMARKDKVPENYND